MTKPNEPEALEKFQREERYIVIKRKYLNNGQEADIRDLLADRGIRTVECVVVESDWPEYETVWSMTEERCSPAHPVTDAGGVTTSHDLAAATVTLSRVRGHGVRIGEKHWMTEAFARHRLQSVAAATAAKDAEIADLKEQNERLQSYVSSQAYASMVPIFRPEGEA